MLRPGLIFALACSDPRDPPESVVGAPDTQPERLFVADRVLPLALTVDDEARAHLMSGRDGYVPATLEFEGESLEVGLRVKGYSTWTAFDDKPSLIVDVNRFTEQRFLGHKQFRLHNSILDPSMLAETLAYEQVRAAGVPGSRTGFVRLSVDGADYGLYTSVESIDGAFLDRWFDDPDGNLYEAGPWNCDLDDPSCFEAEESDEGTDDALAALSADAVLEDPLWEDAMRERLDWGRFVRGLASDILLAHWDGYGFDRSNYRVYHDPSAERWTMISGSRDLDFGWRPFEPGRCGEHGVDPDDYDAGILSRKCLDNASCRADLVESLHVQADVWEASNPVARLDALADLIRDDVATDTRRHRYQFDEQVACLRDWIAARPDQIRAWADGAEEP